MSTPEPAGHRDHARLGANVIRIPLNQTFCKESAPREVIGSYKQIVDAMIYYAIEQKWPSSSTFIGSTPYPRTGQHGQQGAIPLWQDIAKTYANFGTVLFELFNEPHDLDADNCARRRRPRVSGSTADSYAGYQQLYDAVRGADANNLCIVGGLDWAYDLSFVNSEFGVKGTGIVYCSHPYWPKGNDQGGSRATLRECSVSFQ